MQPKQSQINRMKKIREFDKSLRDEVSAKRASQHALEVIYNMSIPTKQFSRLYGLLVDRKLTGTDGDALKKLDKHPLFQELRYVQKSRAINKTLQQARFTNKEAELIILSEIMKEAPNDSIDNTWHWINYLARSLNEISSYIHPDIKLSANDRQIQQLRTALSNLNNLLDWTWSHNYKENRSDDELNKSFVDLDLTSEETQTGYKFRFH
ncbi:hypothetical protein [Oceanobacillus kapialis]|uniref:Uncharacterized protein n=1 Tax=Oceanobacillus kapialis TaxID=481353 RepID=A0ABW5PW07_9BACI